MVNVIQLKITLVSTKPPIWRRLLVPDSITFFDLHHIFQIAMGWKNAHLYDFRVGDYVIGYIDSDAPEDLADANKVTIDTLITKAGMRLNYTYDFGDGWNHVVEVEEILQGQPTSQFPVCLDGKRNCPPEDCGGIPGYHHLLEVLKDKSHPEFPEMKRWVGRGYDPEKFDLEKVNKLLPKFKSYMRMWKG